MTQANNYWDLAERDRAQLSREDVERFIDFELMSKGVLKVTPLVLDPEPQEAAAKRRYSSVSVSMSPWDKCMVLFATAEQAAAFLSLGPSLKRGEYIESEQIEWAEPFPEKIGSVELMDAETFRAQRSQFQSAAAIRASNKKRQEEHEAAIKAQDEALNGLWEDWSRCRAQDRDMRKIAATFADYARTAGSVETASKFLLKVFTAEKIAEASEWCCVEIPLPATEVAAE